MTDIIKFWKKQSYVYETTIRCLRFRIQNLKIQLEKEEHNDIKVRIESLIKDCRNAIKHNDRELKRIYLQITAVEKEA